MRYFGGERASRPRAAGRLARSPSCTVPFLVHGTVPRARYRRARRPAAAGETPAHLVTSCTVPPGETPGGCGRDARSPLVTSAVPSRSSISQRWRCGISVSGRPARARPGVSSGRLRARCRSSCTVPPGETPGGCGRDARSPRHVGGSFSFLGLATLAMRYSVVSGRPARARPGVSPGRLRARCRSSCTVPPGETPGGCGRDARSPRHVGGSFSFLGLATLAMPYFGGERASRPRAAGRLARSPSCTVPFLVYGTAGRDAQRLRARRPLTSPRRRFVLVPRSRNAGDALFRW